jgi:hypothetical protein
MGLSGKAIGMLGAWICEAYGLADWVAADGPCVGDRQIERECAADARRAAQLDFATEEARQLATDRKPQSGSAIFAAGARVGLLECFENDLLFLGGNTNAGVGDLEGDDGLRLAENRVCRGPANRRGRNLELNAAAVGELEGVGQQVLQHLLQTLGVGYQAASKRRIEIDLEGKLSRVRFVTERAAHGIKQVGEEDLFGIDRDRAGFDLREVENVADEVEEVGPGAVYGAGELRLLACEVAVGIVGQLLSRE